MSPLTRQYVIITLLFVYEHMLQVVENQRRLTGKTPKLLFTTRTRDSRPRQSDKQWFRTQL